MIERIEPIANVEIVATYTESGDALVEVWGTSKLEEIVVIDGNAERDESEA